MRNVDHAKLPLFYSNISEFAAAVSTKSSQERDCLWTVSDVVKLYSA